VAVFNGSIAVGALVGSLAVQTAGIGAVTWIGAAAAGLALAVVLISRSSKNAASSLPNNQSTNEEKPTMKG
jgi:predicted MFS family arabinose efflux permease